MMINRNKDRDRIKRIKKNSISRPILFIRTEKEKKTGVIRRNLNDEKKTMTAEKLKSKIV